MQNYEKFNKDLEENKIKTKVSRKDNLELLKQDIFNVLQEDENELENFKSLIDSPSYKNGSHIRKYSLLNYFIIRYKLLQGKKQGFI